MSDEISTANELTQDAENMAILTWVGTIFFGFIPGLILYLVKKDDPYVKDQSKESLNWSITVMLAYLVAMLLSFIVIGVFLIPLKKHRRNFNEKYCSLFNCLSHVYAVWLSYYVSRWG